MKQSRLAVLLSVVALSCVGGGSDATLRIDTSAVQALRAGLDLSTGLLRVACADGRVFEVQVPLEDAAQDFTVALPACGAARAEFRILSTLGIPELQGATDTRLVPGFIELEIPVRYVGQLSVKLADDASVESCIATLERTSPDPEVIDTGLELRRDSVATLIVPVGSYSVTCEERVEAPVVVAGANVNASLADPVRGPRLVGTDIPAGGYPVGTVSVDITLTFSVPVTGVSSLSVRLGGTEGEIYSVIADQRTARVSVSFLKSGDYALVLSDAIVDVEEGLPLVGAPLVVPFTVRSYEYYVSQAGSDGNDGLTPATAWLNPYTALDLATPPAKIFVAAGTYDGEIQIEDELYFEGGWNDTFTVRDVVANETRLRAQTRPVYIESMSAGVDGFTIEGTIPNEVVLFQGSGGYVRNCVILGGAFTGVTYGVVVEGTGLPLIANNVIRLRAASGGRGVQLQQAGSARIIHNTIDAGDIGVLTGVFFTSDSGASTSIVNNLFVGASSSGTRTGIDAAENLPAALLHNVFAIEHSGVYRDPFGGYRPIGSGDFGILPPHRFGGNVNAGETATLVDSDYRPQSANLAIGIDASTADCGFDDVSLDYPCEGPITDRAGRRRTAPTTVGAYQL